MISTLVIIGILGNDRSMACSRLTCHNWRVHPTLQIPVSLRGLQQTTVYHIIFGTFLSGPYHSKSLEKQETKTTAKLYYHL
jgi:hypothetical protein